MDGQDDGRINERLDGWTDGPIDGHTVGRTDNIVGITTVC